MKLFKFQRRDSQDGDCVIAVVRADTQAQAIFLLKKEYRKGAWDCEEIFLEGRPGLILEVFLESYKEDEGV